MAFLYLKKHDPGRLGQQSKLHEKINWVIKDLKDKKFIPEKQLRILQISASSENAKSSPIVFGMMVHLAYLPTKRELIQTWDNYESSLLLIHKYL